jgi:hypothetical protein
MRLLFACMRRIVFSLPLVAALLIIPAAVSAQDNPASKGKDLYDRISAIKRPARAMLSSK